ncbi:MAG TPA: hypothetical protein VFC54_13795 [Pseudolabrys sp.]|nr:hypothetical protein [Pseudolabrys sp.]
MKSGLLVVTLFAALATATSVVPASAQSQSAAATHKAIDKTAVKKKHPVKRVARREDTRQIACTFLGCQRIPPNCTPVTQYTSDGSPTGYDAISCR